MHSVNEVGISFLKENISWLAETSLPLVNLIGEEDSSQFEFKKRSFDQDVDLFFDGQLVLESCVVLWRVY